MNHLNDIIKTVAGDRRYIITPEYHALSCCSIIKSGCNDIIKAEAEDIEDRPQGFVVIKNIYHEVLHKVLHMRLCRMCKTLCITKWYIFVITTKPSGLYYFYYNILPKTSIKRTKYAQINLFSMQCC